MNKKAMEASIRLAKMQNAWGKKAIKNKKWLEQASIVSKEMAVRYAGSSIDNLAKKTYDYCEMRYRTGINSYSNAFDEEIRIWECMKRTGTHPHTELYQTTPKYSE